MSLLSPQLSAALQKTISLATGKRFAILTSPPAGRGCINSALRLQGDSQEYFVKLNRRELAHMFEAEAEGLQEIVATQAVRAPQPVCHGIAGDQAFLVMECLQLRANKAASDRQLGRQLAAMHDIQQPFFGWHRNNTIGSTHQPNERSDDWSTFWTERRLGFQLELAASGGFGGRLQREGEKLLGRIPGLLRGHEPEPSLLHGDLWGGNYAQDDAGQPVIFDPACYYGDREADLAMTELFGGFGGDFYAAYREVHPLDAGYAVRKTLYNLYHILNHLNLFGGGYLGQAESMIGRLLAETR